ncbi:MAG: Gfo/Idh/MocA family oxidoreductase [Phycisphaerae bacterium]|jgi:hypothetical protein|nr:Gfo/Idh/MocA family oxidoreductase [Phycisphaerae bacterium]
MNRRQFLTSSVAAGAIAGLPTVIPSSALGKDGNTPPSDRAAIGIIACGNRARYAGKYKSYAKSEVVAVCDPIEWRRLNFKKSFGGCPDYVDFRELLARKDVDAVHIATADHWHVPIAIAAARAGKDMYAEKPLGISINHDLESRKIVDKYKRVFQYGAQQRSSVYPRLGIELVLNGHIGQVKEILVKCPKGHSGGSATPVMDVPKNINYDMWLGPAPKAPFCADRVLYQPGKWWIERNGIYHIRDYAIGFIAGWGAHPMDMLQWWADNSGMKELVPVKYEGKGTLPTEGLFDTVTHWDVKCRYANGIKMRFMDNDTAGKLKLHKGFGGNIAVLFIGTEGWVRVSRGGWATSSDALSKKARNPGPKRLKVSKDQITNFVDCVLSRETPVDDLHSAVWSDVATHLCDIAIRTGRPINWDSRKETITGDAEAVKMMSRELRKPWTL